MRNTIIFLLWLMFLLFCNIFAYIVSEDYRFFLKKIKYQEEIVYDAGLEVNDNNKVKIIDSSKEQVLNNNEIQSTGTGFNFLSELSGVWKILEPELPALTDTQTSFLQSFQSFDLKELDTNAALFDVTTEYPDPYYTFYAPELTLYIFPTKNYNQIKKIFEVQTFELPYTLNEANALVSPSFFINLDTSVDDGDVRIVGEYENIAFWLKIRKDSYNTVKEIFSQWGN